MLRKEILPFYHNMDGFGRHYTEGNKSSRERNYSIFSLLRKYFKRVIENENFKNVSLIFFMSVLKTLGMHGFHKFCIKTVWKTRETWERDREKDVFTLGSFAKCLQ